MSVEELNKVHRRYVRLSNTFKSAWTFHQFVQNLHKVFTDTGRADYPSDFHGLYSQLKNVSQHLTEAGTEDAVVMLDAVERSLGKLTESLAEVDDGVTPAQLRQFFQRVKSYEDGILSQLVKFYLYTWERGSDDGRAAPGRLDKVDFLTTKLCEEHDDRQDLYVLRERGDVREVVEGFWSALGAEAGNGVGEETLDEHRSALRALREELSAISSIQDLDRSQLVPRHRALKHELGRLYFHPALCRSILETNLVLKNLVQRLYGREEQRIIAEYQQVFDLEREVPVDVQLGEELEEFRAAVERFEEQLEGSNVRLEALARLREKVGRLLPKLRSEHDSGPFVQPREVRDLFAEDDEPAAAPNPEWEYVEEAYQELVGALEGTNSMREARQVAVLPEVFPFRLEAREVIAYRRLFGEVACDRPVEELLLRAAALRRRLEHDVEEVRGLLDDSAVTREGPVHDQARQTLRIADLYCRRFGHLVDQTILAGDVTEAQTLQVLRMRLVRVYSGLWLLIHRQP